MTYKVLSSLTANNINSADLLKVKTDLLIIAVNKKTSAAAELKGLQSITQSLVQESIKEINNGSRKSIFLPAPTKVAAKNILLIKEPDAKAASFLVLRYYEEIISLVKSAKAKDFAYLISSTTSKDFDMVWAAEVAARTLSLRLILSMQQKTRLQNLSQSKKVSFCFLASLQQNFDQ